MYVSNKNQKELYAKLLTQTGLVSGEILVKDGTRTPKPVVLDNPVLYITTQGGAPILNKEDYVTCTYKIVNSLGFGETLFNQPGRIRGRGNSTWTMAKKPWKVKLDTSSTVLGMPKSKDWALLANYVDPSKIRGSLAFEISNRTAALPWAPRSVNVEVYLNQVYQGLYQLTESVEVATTRVNIDELKATHLSGRNLTGGYILEVDTRLEENGEIGWRTRLNVPIIFDTPDGDISEQYNYAKNFTQACEDALFANNFTDGAWKELLDVDSWADWYLLNELVANNDSGFGSSVKMTKSRDPATGPPSKLKLGPAWDFDASCGITFFIPHPTNTWWTRVGATWIARMIEDPSFRDVLKVRWASLRSRLLAEDDSIFDWIAAQEDMLTDAISRDKTLWGDANAPNVASWLQSRIEWISYQFELPFGVTAPPAAPANFTTTGVWHNQVTLAWDMIPTNNGLGVTGYRVRQDGKIIAMGAYPYENNLQGITVGGLTPLTQYTFSVECRNAEGVWSNQSTLQVTTLS